MEGAAEVLDDLLGNAAELRVLRARTSADQFAKEPTFRHTAILVDPRERRKGRA